MSRIERKMGASSGGGPQGSITEDLDRQRQNDADVVAEEMSVVAKLTDEQIWGLLKGFQKFDKDGGGSISTDELEEAMETMGQKPSKEELDAMIAEVDVDGDGEVSFPEFVTMMASQLEADDTEADIREAFNLFDKDGGGSISAEELREGLKAMGEVVTDEEIEEMIKQADVDGNGEIDYEEFRLMMLNKT